MSQLFATGRVGSQPVLKRSERSKRSYVYFTLTERLENGESLRFQNIQVWAWGSDAENLVGQNVTKDSRIWVTGSVELVDYTRKDGTKSMILKLYLAKWGFADAKTPQGVMEAIGFPPAAAPQKEAAQAQAASIQVIRGDKDSLPE